jgi:RNA polymerase subunit RPABC4/transcription elongation factor Spt4
MMMTISLLIAAFAAYWVYNDSRRLGHETGTSIMWAVGTFAFWLLFLPVYLIFGRKPRAVKRLPEVVDVEATPVEETMNCPMCGGKVKDDFKACPYCGNTLRLQCGNCGRELRRDWKTCPYCETPAPPK